jgi:hypothetical protein
MARCTPNDGAGRAANWDTCSISCHTINLTDISQFTADVGTGVIGRDRRNALTPVFNLVEATLEPAVTHHRLAGVSSAVPLPCGWPHPANGPHPTEDGRASKGTDDTLRLIREDFDAAVEARLTDEGVTRICLAEHALFFSRDGVHLTDLTGASTDK